jgi:hypothetical protein
LQALNLIGTKEVAGILQVHERTALRLMQRGHIQAFRLSAQGTGKRGIWRTTRAHVLHYVDMRIAANGNGNGEQPFRALSMLMPDVKA